MKAGEEIVRNHLQVKKIATLDEIKRLLATDARMTVFPHCNVWDTVVVTPDH